MAWAITRTRVVFGNKRGTQLYIVPDSQTFAVDTGLKKINHILFGFGSCTTTAVNVKVNIDCSGTAASGKLGITGVTSGDELYITVFGS